MVSEIWESAVDGSLFVVIPVGVTHLEPHHGA